MKEKIIRITILFIGLIIAHLGVSLFLQANLGSDPFNVMIQGLNQTISKWTTSPLVTHGNIHMTVSILVIIILLFVDRTYIKAGTLICMFCGGPIIDIFNLLIGGIITPESSMAIRFACNIIGCIILACGMSIVIKSDAGTGPNDLVGVVISDKFRYRFSIVRMSVDGVFLTCGWLMGGIVGIGTVICLFLVGPIAGFVMPKCNQLILHILEKYAN